MKLGYLKMLVSFTHHKPGLDWLMSTDCWNDILSYCLENQTIYITREGYNFMYELLDKSINVNQTFCELVTKKTMFHLEADQFNKNGLVKSEINDYQIQKDLTPTLKLVTHILEQCYLSDTNHNLSQIYLQQLNLENVLWNLLMIGRDHEFIFDISKPIYLTCFMGLKSHSYTTRESALPELKNFGRKFSNLFNTLINKQCAVEVLKLCCIGHGYWRKINSLLPPSDKKEPILFENQIIIFQIMPMIIIAFTGAGKQEIREDELTELFINKLFKISCEHTIRMAYTYRTLLLSLDMSRAYDVAQKAVFYLMRIRQHLHRDRAVIAFQALAYAMKYLSHTLIRGDRIELRPYQTSFLSAMIEGIGQLIKDFRITWTDSVESICITSLALDFLSCVDLPTKLCVQTMQLAHLTIAHFMPPNMALLVSELHDSSVQRVSAVLGARLRDQAWEVRDSALETLHTVADISRERFPPFQQLIVEARLCEATVEMAASDEEAFVRASALRALAGMVRTPAYWNGALAAASLLDTALGLLADEPEALVRCEAARLARHLYESGRVPEVDMPVVLAAMSAAAVADLHWEVRVAALDFWACAIDRELADQGMLDGAFPPVTFSRDRKIVQLTEREVRTRLNVALDRLADAGCLAVLQRTAVDTCDLQVARRAVRITNELARHLRRYSLLDGVDATAAPGAPRDAYRTGSVRAPPREHALSDDVIEAIVNSSDASLLGGVAGSGGREGRAPPSTRVLPPHVFKQFVAQDLDAQLETRSSWLASVTDDLGSLLDDILQSYEDNDVNAMDCY